MKDEDGNPIPGLADDFQRLGINIQDANGQIKPTYDILNDLSKVWKELDKNTQMMFLEKVAGKIYPNVQKCA